MAKENEVFLVENEKENILAAAMPFVLEYGWSKEAVAKGDEKFHEGSFSQVLQIF